MGLGGHPQPVPAPGSACAFPWTLLSPSRLATLIVSAPHRLQSLSFIHALPVQLKELVIGMNASYSVVFFFHFVCFLQRNRPLRSGWSTRRRAGPREGLLLLFFISHIQVWFSGDLLCCLDFRTLIYFIFMCISVHLCVCVRVCTMYMPGVQGG